jgi:hypothetical protein
MNEFFAGMLAGTIGLVVIGFLDEKILGHWATKKPVKLSWKHFAYVSAFELLLFFGGYLVGRVGL